MAKHDKEKSSPDEAKLIALRILEGAASGIISGLVVYWLTK